MLNIKSAWILILNLFAVFAGYAISNLEKFGLCTSVYKFETYMGCSDKIVETLGQPLFIYSLFVLPFALTVLFFSTSTRKIWVWFTFWWSTLSSLLIFITPTSNNTWIPLYAFEREGVTWIMGILFALVSVGIIARKSLRKG